MRQFRIVEKLSNTTNVSEFFVQERRRFLFWTWWRTEQRLVVSYNMESFYTDKVYPTLAEAEQAVLNKKKEIIKTVSVKYYNV